MGEPPDAGVKLMLTPLELAGSGKPKERTPPLPNPEGLKFVPFTTKMLPWAMFAV